MQPPGEGGFLLGSDSLGRDVAAGIAHGAKTSLLIGLLATIVAVGFGTIMGGLAGYYGGRIDDLLIRAAGLSFVALGIAAGGMALLGLAEASGSGGGADVALFGGWGPLLALGALCPLALFTAGFVLRRREKRIAAVWSLLRQK